MEGKLCLVCGRTQTQDKLVNVCSKTSGIGNKAIESLVSHGHPPNENEIVAECLSTRLLILQCVFSVGGVWL